MEKEKKKCGIGWFRKKDDRNYMSLIIDGKRYAMFDNTIEENRNKFDFVIYESAPKDKRDKGKQGIGWRIKTNNQFTAIIKINDAQFFITTNKFKSDSSTFDVIVYPYINKKEKKGG